MSIPSARTLQVVVGGVNGYADLAVRSNFADGLSTGRLGLYTHGNGVIDEGRHGVNTQVGAAFAGTGPGVAEFGVYAPGFFSTSYPSLWKTNGLGVAEANLNLDYSRPAFLREFVAFVNEGRSVAHVQNFAPIFSPNSSALYNGAKASLGTGFLDPRWAAIRTAALYGGGIAFDTPPRFTSLSPSWYLTFVEQEIRWANALGLRSSVIVSPYTSGASYMADAQAFEQRLVRDHAVPTQWVIESYAENADGTYPTDGSYPNPIGSEKTPNTQAAVADWFARNAPTAVPGASAGTWRVQNADGTFGDTFTGSADTRTLIDASAAGRTTYSYAADGTPTGSATVAAPRLTLAKQAPDARVVAGDAFTFKLPAGSFADSSGARVALSARLADLSGLPSWLRFDAAGGTFSGTAPATPANLSVRVDAVASDGLVAAETFRVAVLPAQPSFVGSSVSAAGASVSLGAGQDFSVAAAPVSAAHAFRIARAADLGPLPSWVAFDPATGALSGVTPAAHGSLAVRIDEAPAGGGLVMETFHMSW